MFLKNIQLIRFHKPQEKQEVKPDINTEVKLDSAQDVQRDAKPDIRQDIKQENNNNDLKPKEL